MCGFVDAFWATRGDLANVYVFFRGWGYWMCGSISLEKEALVFEVIFSLM